MKFALPALVVVLGPRRPHDECVSFVKRSGKAQCCWSITAFCPGGGAGRGGGAGPRLVQGAHCAHRLPPCPLCPASRRRRQRAEPWFQRASAATGAGRRQRFSLQRVVLSPMLHGRDGLSCGAAQAPGPGLGGQT